MHLILHLLIQQTILIWEDYKFMAISKLVMPTKTVSVPHPDYKTFVVDLKYISRETSRKISKESQRLRMEAKDIEVEDITFNTLYAKEAFSGWKGLTYDILSHFVLIDTSQVSDMNEEVPFSLEDAAFLMTASQPFEAWVNKVVFDIDNFRG